ncbi:zinc-binding dehydrogenase [Haloechinothrix salitolerans]|uniref:Zinc-binding dehydrogenase n=1 Tax=Haloechinothrix salitolerans TaxID=926830 RepID=A0ABW2C583_9PSEU
MRVRQFGGIDQLGVEDVPIPSPLPGQVLIRLRAAGLNQADILVREGRFIEIERQQRLPISPGVEGAGEVVAVGEGVTTHKVEDRVVILPMLTCHACPACASGEVSRCPELRIVGEHCDGTYVEYIALPAANALLAPPQPSWEQLAVSVVGYMTAWHMLLTRGGLRSGETVVVVGAGSGMGSAAIQVAKSVGAAVIATTGSDAKCGRALEVGADHAVNYADRNDWHDAVKELTNGKGADLVHDTVGGATFQRSINALRHGGRLVCMGSHSGRSAEVQLVSIHRNEVDIRGCHTASMSEVREFLPKIGSDWLQPIVDTTFSMNEVQAAHERLASPERFGKVALLL